MKGATSSRLPESHQIGSGSGHMKNCIASWTVRGESYCCALLIWRMPYAKRLRCKALSPVTGWHAAFRKSYPSGHATLSIKKKNTRGC